MKETLLVALLLVIPPAHSMTGNDILNSCAAVIEPSGLSDEKSAMEGMHCIGYVNGLNDMAVVASHITNKQLYCLPATGLESGQVVRVFLKWLKDNPAQLHETARTSFLIAMRQAFPCEG